MRLTGFVVGVSSPLRPWPLPTVNIYQLGQLETVGHFLTTSTVRKCPTISNHDAFRHKGLAKSAGEILQVLLGGPATDEELVERTGRCMKTIRRWLHVMATLTNPLTGEYLPMVASEDGKTWHALDIDLDNVAHAVGTAGKGERQRLQHAKERDADARSLLVGSRHSEASPPQKRGCRKVVAQMGWELRNGKQYYYRKTR